MARLLKTETLDIANKRFYIDAKENARGRFINIAELNNRGNRNHVILSMATARLIVEKLKSYAEKDKEMGSHDMATFKPNQENVITTETIRRDNRIYHVDLKENRMGRFLRLAMTQSLAAHTRIAVPAEAFVQVADIVQAYLDEFTLEDDIGSKEMPEPGSFRMGNKVFYFDVNAGPRGVNLVVSDVRPTFRTAITVPDRACRQFRDMLNDYCDQMEKLGLLNKRDVVNAGGDAVKDEAV